jgi:hypothetical protein
MLGGSNSAAFQDIGRFGNDERVSLTSGQGSTHLITLYPLVSTMADQPTFDSFVRHIRAGDNQAATELVRQ